MFSCATLAFVIALSWKEATLLFNLEIQRSLSMHIGYNKLSCFKMADDLHTITIILAEPSHPPFSFVFAVRQNPGLNQ